AGFTLAFLPHRADGFLWCKLFSAHALHKASPAYLATRLHAAEHVKQVAPWREQRFALQHAAADHAVTAQQDQGNMGDVLVTGSGAITPASATSEDEGPAAGVLHSGHAGAATQAAGVRTPQLRTDQCAQAGECI